MDGGDEAMLAGSVDASSQDDDDEDDGDGDATEAVHGWNMGALGVKNGVVGGSEERVEAGGEDNKTSVSGEETMTRPDRRGTSTGVVVVDDRVALCTADDDEESLDECDDVGE